MNADKSPTDWRSLTVAECLREAPPQRRPSIQQELYQARGKFPVIDQGQGYIAGWTDAPESVIGDALPVIVFGDHTRVFKYVDFPFALGADGTKLLYPAAQFLDSEFFYFALLNLDVPSKGCNRHYRYLRELRVRFPANKAEQRAIARVLRTAQAAREARQREVSLERERKAALMAHLFTHGTRGEPTKQTQIGEMPASWEVVRLAKCAYIQTGTTKERRFKGGEATIEVPYLRVANVQDGYLDLSEIKYIKIRASEYDRYRLKAGDVLMTEGGDADKLGRGFIWNEEVPGCVHQNHVFAVRVNRELLTPEFLSYQTQSPYGKAYFLNVGHRTTNLASINSTKLGAYPVLLAPRDEQERIVDVLSACDAKIAALERESALLDELFRALLEELMTGRVAVAGLREGNG